jgi:dihydrofolate reductase
MGDGGERLHVWMAGNGTDSEIDVGVRREVDATVGAAVIGRRTFDLGLGPWGGTPWPGVPSFVDTHRARQDLLGDNGGTFAFDGLQAAVRRAKQAAGHKDVLVLGADAARQCSEQTCSTRYASTSFRSCWVREQHCSTGSRPS